MKLSSSIYKALTIALVISLATAYSAHAQENSQQNGTPGFRAQIESHLQANSQIRNQELEGRQGMMASGTPRDEMGGPGDGHPPFATSTDGHWPHGGMGSTTPPWRMGSTTPRMMGMDEGMGKDRGERRDQDGLWTASSTNLFKKPTGTRPNPKQMMFHDFEMRKNALSKQLDTALSNLTTISTRIQTRISDEQGKGVVVDNAVTLFATAQIALAQAQKDVAAFDAITASSTGISGTGSTTPEVSLSKPRTLGDTAIKSLKAARDAMEKVVDALGKDMGAFTGSSTPPDHN